MTILYSVELNQTKTMAKIALKKTELEEHLEEQIEFLLASCEDYDNGRHSEAKRIAATIRILFHDTGHSKSLLSQLGKKDASFFSSNLPILEQSLTSHSGLIMIGMKGKDTIYYPKLDEMSFSSTWLPFKEWWDEHVFMDGEGNKLSRYDLICYSTNQDGGAHVDPALDEVYYNLKKTNSLNTSIFDGDNHFPIPNPEKAAIRQIGHEVLKTLIVDYEKKQDTEVDVWLAGNAIVKGTNIPPIHKSRKIGRNEKCPCGSGYKYKFCHGK